MHQAGHHGRAEALLIRANHHDATAMSGCSHLPGGIELVQGELEQCHLLAAQGLGAIKPETMGELMANGQQPHAPELAHLALVLD
jgi:hypothetical protein